MYWCHHHNMDLARTSFTVITPTHLEQAMLCYCGITFMSYVEQVIKHTSRLFFVSHMPTLPVMHTLLVLVHSKQLLCLSSHPPAVRPKFSSAHSSHRLLTVWGQITRAGPGPAVIGHFPTANTLPQGPFPFLCQQNTSS